MTDYQQIVWLASYPKSGNTWVRMLLDAYYLAELDINEILTSVSDDFAPHHQVGDGSDVRTFPVDIQALTRPMAMLRLVRAYLSDDNARALGVPLVAKTHNANLLVNGHELLPEPLTKAVIYIVRDPRDVAPSFQRHMGMDTMDEAIDEMLNKHRVLGAGKETNKVSDFISSWPLHVNSYINADSHNIKYYRYEDLRHDPATVFADMLVHAGVKADMDRVRQAVEITDLSKVRQQEAEKGFREHSPHAETFFGRGEVGTGKRKLSPAQRHRLEKACASYLKRIYNERRAA